MTHYRILVNKSFYKILYKVQKSNGLNLFKFKWVDVKTADNNWFETKQKAQEWIDWNTKHNIQLNSWEICE